MQNSVKVVSILSKARLHDIEDDVHEKVIGIVLSPHNSPTMHLKSLFEVPNGLPVNIWRNDKYWASVIEALFVVHYDRAEVYLQAMFGNLNPRRISASGMSMYPAAIIALLKVGAWADKGKECENAPFEECLPKAIGVLLNDFAEGARERRDYQVSEWAVHEFSNSLSSYFQSLYPEEALRRVVLLSGVTQKIDGVSANAAPLFMELVGRYQQMFTIGEHLRLLGPAISAKADPTQ